MVAVLAMVLGIIGGTPSSDDAVVCISADTLPVCSGVLIAPHTVVTAGHCVYPLGTGVKYWVNFGADCRKPTSRIAVTNMVTNPLYTGEGKPYDAGLVQLASASSVTPIPLSAATIGSALTGRTIRHVGYGTNQEFPYMDGSGIRRTVSHAVLSVDDSFVWSGDASANTCIGDSGGALLLDEQLIGVVSDGPDCHSRSADQRLDVVLAWLGPLRDSFDPPVTPDPMPTHGCASAPGGVLMLAVLLTLRRVR